MSASASEARRAPDGAAMIADRGGLAPTLAAKDGRRGSCSLGGAYEHFPVGRQGYLGHAGQPEALPQPESLRCSECSRLIGTSLSSFAFPRGYALQVGGERGGREG